MGAFAGCIALDTACCLGTTACKCCFSVLGLAASKVTRIAYSLLFLLNSVLAWIMLSDWAINKLKERLEQYPFYKLNCPEGLCYGTLATYRCAYASLSLLILDRVTFSLALFHAVMALITIGVKNGTEIRATIHNGYWGPKLVLYILTLVVSFYMPNGFFMAYGSVSMFAAGLFIIMQLILLIDCAYKVSEKCLQEYESTEDLRWIYLLGGMTFALVIGFIVATVFLFLYFGPSSCGLNQFFISFNLVLALISCVVSILPVVQEANPQVGLPQASFVAAYALYLVASSLSNEPDDKCNPFTSAKGPRDANIIVGAILTFLALAYSASSAAVSSQSMLGGSGGADYQIMLEGGGDASGEFEDEEDGVNYSYSFFHLTFAVASMYVAMLLTDWDSLQKTDSTVRVGQSWTAVWIKIVTSWVCLLMYIWTLLAPVLLTDREFF